MERRIWLYVDRELPADEIAEVSKRLEECERCREFYLACSREANSYRVALVETPFGEEFTASFVRRMEDEGLVDPGTSTGRRSGAGSRDAVVVETSSLWRRVLSLAALFLFVATVVTLGFYSTRSFPPPTLGVLRSEGHAVSLLRGQQPDARLVESGEVRAGDRLIVPDGTDLFLTLRPTATSQGEQSLLRLVGPARFYVDADARSDLFAASLETGLLVADVGKDSLRRGFTIESGSSAVEVVGTRFALRSDESESRLTVYHGQVNFRYLGGTNHAPVRVTARTGSFRTEVDRAGIFAATDLEVPEIAGRPDVAGGHGRGAANSPLDDADAAPSEMRVDRPGPEGAGGVAPDDGPAPGAPALDLEPPPDATDSTSRSQHPVLDRPVDE